MCTSLRRRSRRRSRFKRNIIKPLQSQNKSLSPQVALPMSLERQIELLSQSQPGQSQTHSLTLIQTYPQVLHKMVHIEPRLQNLSSRSYSRTSLATWTPPHPSRWRPGTDPPPALPCGGWADGLGGHRSAEEGEEGMGVSGSVVPCFHLQFISKNSNYNL
jgi:hypothetical protein